MPDGAAATQRGGRADRCDDPALPSGPARGEGALPNPVLRLRNRLGRAAGPTRRYAAMAPRGEVKLYPEGHFAIYVGDAFERVIADQLEFLGRVLPT